MDAGYADVVNGVDFVAHHFGGDLGFFGDGEIAGAGADHGDHSFAARLAVAPDSQRAGGFEIFGGGMFVLNAVGCFGTGPGDQKIGRFGQQAMGDRGDLVRRLAESEDHFRHAVAQAAVVIDFGEAEVFKRQVTHALHRGVDFERAVADLIEQRAQVILIHTLQR